VSYPAVTIGVTTYNAQDTILDALNSAVSQSVEIKQIIIVDDCSTDNTLSIVEQFDRHPCLEIYRNPVNSGVAVSRNVIVEHAKGDFIAFFDDDDISLASRVEVQLSRILEYEREFANGAPVICHTARRQVYPHGKERIEPTMGTRIGFPAPSGPAVARRALIGEPLEDGYGSCATCSQMGRTEQYRKLGGFDPVFRRCEDSDFVIRFAIQKGHFVGVAEPLVVQKMTSTSDKSLEQLKNYWLLLMKKHQGLFGTDDIYRFCGEWIELKYNWLANQRAEFARKFMQLIFKHPVLTARRIYMAVPTLSGNRAFKRHCVDLTDNDN
jgi:glycosyltransferase involved in cell wall biosynthesis